MNTPTTRDGWVSMPLDEFGRLIEDAAERGAKRAMADVGLDGQSAAADIRELRGLLEAFNTAKHTAWETLVRMVTTGFILALVTLLQTDGVTLAAALQATWDEETQALFAAVMSFWFGSRQISKMRRGS